MTNSRLAPDWYNKRSFKWSGRKAGAERAEEKTLWFVILRSSDRIGTTKDLGSSVKQQLRGFFASLRMTGLEGFSVYGKEVLRPGLAGD
jgi:hypothetical protein